MRKSSLGREIVAALVGFSLAFAITFVGLESTSGGRERSDVVRQDVPSSSLPLSERIDGQWL